MLRRPTLFRRLSIGLIGLLGLLGFRRRHGEDSYHPAPLE